MRSALLILLFLGIVNLSFGQQVNISLSPEHSEKLNKLKGSKRMLKYYKYYKADSTKSVKARIKKNKKEWDSLRQAEIMNARVTERLHNVRDKENYIDSIQQAYSISYTVLSNSDTTAQAGKNARAQLKNIAKNKISLELARHGQLYFRFSTAQKRK